MYKELNESVFEYVIIGTSLTEAILSSKLAKAKKKILHLEVSKQYGGDCKTMSYRDLKLFKEDKNNFHQYDSYSKDLNIYKEFYIDNFEEVEKIKQYNFDINPKFIYSKSKSTEELTNSKASQYLEFIPLKSINILVDTLVSVPCTKSDIFQSKHLELLEKQKLLSFIFSVIKISSTQIDVNATTDYHKSIDFDSKLTEFLEANKSENVDKLFEFAKFSEKLNNIIKYVLADINPNYNTQFITIGELINRVHKYITSIQVYDDSPFLCPIYGSSEFSQALCRVSAVYNSIFIVNDSLQISIYRNEEHLVNNDASMYFVKVFDIVNNEEFIVETNKIIINDIYLSSTAFHIQEELFNESVYDYHHAHSDSDYEKYIAFFMLQHETQLRNHREGPLCYKILKNHEKLSNDYGFTCFEYFKNSDCAPHNRSVLQIIIYAEKNENFIPICENIAESFVSFHIQNIKEEMEINFNKLEDLIKKEEIQSNPIITQIIGSVHLHQKITKNKLFPLYYVSKDGNFIITNNNYENLDIDNYYESANSILEKLNINIDELEKEEEEAKEANNLNDSLDELFEYTLNL